MNGKNFENGFSKLVYDDLFKSLVYTGNKSGDGEESGARRGSSGGGILSFVP